MAVVKAVFIVGLPGSGKTHLALHEYVPQGFVLVDDPGRYSEIEAAIALGKDLVLTHPLFTMASNRRLAEREFAEHNFEIEWVFFENNPDRAETNLKHRNDDRGPINTRAFSRLYEIPDGVATLPIWTPP